MEFRGAPPKGRDLPTETQLYLTHKRWVKIQYTSTRMRNIAFISAFFIGALCAGYTVVAEADTPLIIVSNPDAKGVEACGKPIGRDVSYLQALSQAIERCLIYPPYMQDGAKCRLQVSQTQQGVVTNIRVFECIGHPKLGDFAERAVLKASPLPIAPKESSFLPVFGIVFSPDITKYRQSQIADAPPLQNISIDQPPPLPPVSEQEAVYITKLYQTIEPYLSFAPREIGGQCRVRIFQDRSGNVQEVQPLKCDSIPFAASVQAGIMKASPLPLPSEPEIFKPQLELTFVAFSEEEKLRRKSVTTNQNAQNESNDYEMALGYFKDGKYKLSQDAFANFTLNYPNSSLAPNAQYWLGNSLYAQHNFGQALEAYKKTFEKWPDNPKASDALLGFANCQSELGNKTAARRSYEELISKYSSSMAAERARKIISK